MWALVRVSLEVAAGLFVVFLRHHRIDRGLVAFVLAGVAVLEFTSWLDRRIGRRGAEPASVGATAVRLRIQVAAVFAFTLLAVRMLGPCGQEGWFPSALVLALMASLVFWILGCIKTGVHPLRLGGHVLRSHSPSLFWCMVGTDAAFLGVLVVIAWRAVTR